MNKEIRKQVNALNVAWQRYARAREQQLDTVPMEALKRDYRRAWERLDACGIAEWMLVYDPTTLAFSLPEERIAEDEPVPRLFEESPISEGSDKTEASRDEGVA